MGQFNNTADRNAALLIRNCGSVIKVGEEEGFFGKAISFLKLSSFVF
jgi:hypothetical protein